MRGQRTLGAVVLVFIVAALAFTQPPAKAPKAPAGQSKPAVHALGTPADEAAVRALAEEYQQAFNASDASKAAAVYAENGVFVDVNGKAWQGRAEIEKDLAGGNPSARPRLTLTVQGVRFIKPDVALMRGSSMVQGGNVPPGGGAGHWAVVAMKAGGQWKIVAAEAAANPPLEGRGR
jgi:uncharacterized protein (TIGR02246 family)